MKKVLVDKFTNIWKNASPGLPDKFLVALFFICTNNFNIFQYSTRGRRNRLRGYVRNGETGRLRIFLRVYVTMCNREPGWVTVDNVVDNGFV